MGDGPAARLRQHRPAPARPRRPRSRARSPRGCAPTPTSRSTRPSSSSPRPLRRLVRRAATVGPAGRDRPRASQGHPRAARTWPPGGCCTSSCAERAERGGPADPRLAFCVTFDELPRYLEDPDDLRGDDRGAVRAGALPQRARAAVLVRAARSPTRPPGRRGDAAARRRPAAGGAAHGIAVNGGRASGRARVIADPGDPRGLEPGEVLVCAITDPSWTPLFLAAAAVVCDTGAHAEPRRHRRPRAGHPAVMSVPGITTRRRRHGPPRRRRPRHRDDRLTARRVRSSPSSG